ncbi:MAG: SAM-dependent methyltransferase [Bacteroidota bacterium]|nr:SAM-dependent methyltransferase [Bacteroidota bacterium]
MFTKEPSSYKDKSGFVFWYHGEVFRCVSPAYKNHYEHFIDSGLSEKLTSHSLIIAHHEVDDTSIFPIDPEDIYKVIKPKTLPFISYPYEWSYEQLKDAALATLKILRISLDHGMILKDAHPFNIQFVDNHPLLIDTLSFEKYTEGTPWVAYKQFCEAFIAPLAVLSQVDNRLNNILRTYTDGIPLDIVPSLLPLKSKLKIGLLLHLFWHARFSSRRANGEKIHSTKVSMASLQRIISSLEDTIRSLRPKLKKTLWNGYYEHDHVTSAYVEKKSNFLINALTTCKINSLLDVGSNEGMFSLLASKHGVHTIAVDSDPNCVEKLFLIAKREERKLLTPLIVNLVNPSPSFGWNYQTQINFWDRIKRVDCILSYALIHHLVLTNHISFSMIAEQFAHHCRYLIIEFVGKEDPQAQELIQLRQTLFDEYNEDNFEREFKKYFSMIKKEPLVPLSRTLYLMESM